MFADAGDRVLDLGNHLGGCDSGESFVVEVGGNGPGWFEAWVGDDSFDDGCPIIDWVELGVVVIVLCDEFESNMRFLVAEVDCDRFGQVEVRVGVGNDRRSIREHDVLYFDGSRFAILEADEKVLAAAEGVEQGAPEQLSAGDGSWVFGVGDDVAENDWRHCFLVLDGRV